MGCPSKNWSNRIEPRFEEEDVDSCLPCIQNSSHVASCGKSKKNTNERSTSKSLLIKFVTSSISFNSDSGRAIQNDDSESVNTSLQSDLEFIQF